LIRLETQLSTYETRKMSFKCETYSGLTDSGLTEEEIREMFAETQRHKEENKKLMEQMDKMEKRLVSVVEAWQKDSGPGLRGGERCKELQAENEKLKNEKKELREWVDRNQDEIDRLRLVIDESDEVEKLEENLEKAVETIEFSGRSLEKLIQENDQLKEEVIAERKKVAEGNKDRWFVGEMWRAESEFLQMPSAKNQPEEFNDFLKEEFDDDMYKQMYDAFDLEELLECTESDEEESDDSE
jgi:chromosome segregation ATPase